MNEISYTTYESCLSMNSGLPMKKYFHHEEEKFDISIKESLSHFVMTDEKYIKRYCSNLLIYEKYYIRHDKTYKSKTKVSKLVI